jgi:hypothetical protein
MWYLSSGVTRNERARGKNCEMVPHIYFFYLKGYFSAASTHLLYLLQLFFVFNYRLNISYKAF